MAASGDCATCFSRSTRCDAAPGQAAFRRTTIRQEFPAATWVTWVLSARAHTFATNRHPLYVGRSEAFFIVRVDYDTDLDCWLYNPGGKLVSRDHGRDGHVRAGRPGPRHPHPSSATWRRLQQLPHRQAVTASGALTTRCRGRTLPGPAQGPQTQLRIARTFPPAVHQLPTCGQRTTNY
jgi:hypothetical protein